MCAEQFQLSVDRFAIIPQKFVGKWSYVSISIPYTRVFIVSAFGMVVRSWSSATFLFQHCRPLQ